MKQEFTEILIIGAGPSGIVSASYLQNQGLRPLVIEKTKFPRFSIGESLIPQVMDNLEEAGLLEAVKNAGFQKKYGARFIRDKEVAEFNFSEKFGEGWDWTWQVPRADFDNLLAEEAKKKGVDIRFEINVESVLRIDGKFEVIVTDKFGEESKIITDFIIDSSGYGRVLAKQFNLEAPPKIASHSSVYTHIKETNRPKGKEGEQISFEIIDKETWFWYIPFSNGNSSLGFVAPNSWFDQFSEESDKSFSEMLKTLDFYGDRFEEEDLLFSPVKIQNISKNVTQLVGDGFVLTGNSAEFLDPVFSSGVSFATASGLRAAKLLIQQKNGEDVNWEDDYVKYIKEGVNVFSTYVKEWYSGKLQNIIFHPAPNPIIKEQICAVLAGYVWDKKNPFVRNHQRILDNVQNLIAMTNSGIKDS